MAISEKEHELISKYLDASLSQEEREQFDELLSSSDEFNEEFELQLGLVAGIHAHHKADLKKEFKAAFDTMADQGAGGSESKQFYLKPWFYWTSAAAAVILILAVVFPGWLGKGLTGNEIFKSYYEALPATVITRSDDKPEAGLQLYQDRKFSEAIPFLKSLDEKSDHDMAKVYLGIAHMEIGESEQAEQTFRKIKSESEDPFVTQYASWYLSMLLLKNNEIEKARVELELIVANNSPYSDQARAILDELN